jgi:hypothetical protein
MLRISPFSCSLPRAKVRKYISRCNGAGEGHWGHFKLGLASTWPTPTAGLRERDFSVGPLIRDANLVFSFLMFTL